MSYQSIRLPHKSKFFFSKLGNMKKFITFAVFTTVLSGCALIPVQDQTLKNADGGVVTCKQVGAGLISASIGKSRFEECIEKARADGYK